MAGAGVDRAALGHALANPKDSGVIRFAEPKHRTEWAGLDGRLRMLVWFVGGFRFVVYGSGVTVTSVSSGTHSTGSKHYSNRAVDLRSRDLAGADKEAFYSFVRGAAPLIGASAILEDLNGANEHLHVQLNV